MNTLVMDLAMVPMFAEHLNDRAAFITYKAKVDADGKFFGPIEIITVLRSGETCRATRYPVEGNSSFK